MKTQFQYPAMRMLWVIFIVAISISNPSPAFAVGITFINHIVPAWQGNNHVWGIYRDGDRLYVAGNAGLAISSDGGNSFFNRTRANGLGADVVLALDLLELIQNAPGNIYLVGHSAGADAVILAVDLAVQQNTHKQIKSVVLLDPYFIFNRRPLEK